MDTSNFKEVFESPKVKTLTAQVAALEAEVMRLRNALEQIKLRSISLADAQVVALEALSTPFTPQALHELIEKVERRTIERCAKEVFKLPEDIDEYESPIVAANKSIRALPTGQIKLEELL